MKITIHAIGSLKERYWKEAVEEYRKRLQPYAEVKVVEYRDYPTPMKASEKEEEAIKEKECDAVLKKLAPSDYLVLLDLNAPSYDSLAFSKQVEEWLRLSGSSLHFLIGGSLGLSEAIRKRANARFSLSVLTFPHQLARVILLEQLYRAFRIAHHEPYHK